MSKVVVRRETVRLPTYRPAPAESFPVYPDARVYQGSSGRIYPLPLCERIEDTATPQDWEAIILENDYLLVMIFPALGGRVHRLYDKVGKTDLVQYQTTIKPALVGLNGPWISGGIEFNWPQHHRPSTFLPTDVHIAKAPDGSVTVWLSEHDPLCRMKGMHGLCLHPDRSVLELKVRIHNRTPDMQTFLWWANAGIAVDEHYQVFFPPDCTHVVDHARRDLSTFPRCSGRYYGVDYAALARSAPRSSGQSENHPPSARSAPDDISWYANIPVPTSYMAAGTKHDFFGGYDHGRQSGLVHVADRQIAPGKKLWTWGHHEFGRAWNRNLTEPDARGHHQPYIELMAGVYSDNQPDFSWLHPGETKAWSQFWYPIRQTGPVQQANARAAVSVRVTGGELHLGLAVTEPFPQLRVTLFLGNRRLNTLRRSLTPASPLTETVSLPKGSSGHDLRVVVENQDEPIIEYRLEPAAPLSAEKLAQLAAVEVPAPIELASTDELYLAGLHLEQYRHATRRPEQYWQAACRRDLDDSRCRLALGRHHLRRGEFATAEKHLQTGIRRLTRLNANPADGEPFYQLGRCLRFLGRETEAAEALAKAAWSQPWRSTALHALAEIDCSLGRWNDALNRLDQALRLNWDDLRIRNLQTIVLRCLGRSAEAGSLLAETLRLDPLDWWARHLAGEPLTCSNSVRLDLALDCARAGLLTEALELLADADLAARDGSVPLVHLYRAWLAHRRGDSTGEKMHLKAAAAADPGYCFPNRLEEIAILEQAIQAAPKNGRAAFYLGNLLNGRGRVAEAITHWEQSSRLEPTNATCWRNLGLAYFTHERSPSRARTAYAQARQALPRDARLLSELLQLWRACKVPPATRLLELEKHSRLVHSRDDLSVELCALYNHSGRTAEALQILTSRRFQPWEGGEGRVLAEYTRCHLLLGQKALAGRNSVQAIRHFEAALSPPENLGESFHPLVSRSDLFYWLGEAHAAAGDRATACRHWQTAAQQRGDFVEMSPVHYSARTWYIARALERLGQVAEARQAHGKLLAHAVQLVPGPVDPGFFVTSAPAWQLFPEDPAERLLNTAQLLEAQARFGLGEPARAVELLREIIRRNPDESAALDLLDQIKAGRQLHPTPRKLPHRGAPVSEPATAGLPVG